MRQHVGLTFGGGGAVAAHGREDEGMHALRFPEFGGGARDGGDIGDAAAAYADGDARAGFKPRGESGVVELPLDFGGHIGDAAVGKVLTHEEKTGKLHRFMVTKPGTGAFPGNPLAVGRGSENSRSGLF